MPVTIRFPEETLREAKRVAEAQRRSFNGMVVTAVERAIAEHLRREARRPTAAQVEVVREPGQEQGREGREGRGEAGDGR